MSILHICREEDWEAAKKTGEYRPASLATEGFIHSSLPEQVAATAARYYSGQQGLILLVIEPGKLNAELRYEQAKNGQMYPHIYGPLNCDAVIEVKPLEWSDGVMR